VLHSVFAAAPSKIIGRLAGNRISVTRHTAAKKINERPKRRSLLTVAGCMIERVYLEAISGLIVEKGHEPVYQKML
jgi:hypothetical protein